MIYWNKADYVKALDKVLSVRPDHKELKYIKNEDGEYLILSAITGEVFFFNVTGYSEAMMLHTIAVLEAGKAPMNLITNTAKKMAIAQRM